jgi:hypothetical protein
MSAWPTPDRPWPGASDSDNAYRCTVSRRRGLVIRKPVAVSCCLRWPRLADIKSHVLAHPCQLWIYPTVLSTLLEPQSTSFPLPDTQRAKNMGPQRRLDARSRTAGPGPRAAVPSHHCYLHNLGAARAVATSWRVESVSRHQRENSTNTTTAWQTDCAP